MVELSTYPSDLTQTLRSTHRGYLRSLYGAQEKKAIISLYNINDWFLQTRLNAFTARYGMDL